MTGAVDLLAFAGVMALGQFSPGPAMILLTRASILKAGCRSSRAMCCMAAASSCSISFIHSSLVWCCTMNSISSCAGESGFCALRMASSCR